MKKSKIKRGRDRRAVFESPHYEESEPEKKFPIKLYIWDFKQCDPKKCTGMKLKRKKYVEFLTPGHSFKGLVLT